MKLIKWIALKEYTIVYCDLLVACGRYETFSLTYGNQRKGTGNKKKQAMRKRGCLFDKPWHPFPTISYKQRDSWFFSHRRPAATSPAIATTNFSPFLHQLTPVLPGTNAAVVPTLVNSWGRWPRWHRLYRTYSTVCGGGVQWGFLLFFFLKMWYLRLE